MKVCVFTENYYKGGLDTFLVNIFNSWPEEKDELTLCCNSSHAGLVDIKNKTKRPLRVKEYNQIFTGLIFKDINNSFLGSSIQKKLFNISYKILEYPILFPWYLISLTFFFIRNDFDRLMVVNGGYPASLLCRSALIAWRLSGKRPLGVLNFHNSATKASWYNILIEDLIDKCIVKSSSSIVTVSKNCRDSLRIRTNFLDFKNLTYIYNGIEKTQNKLISKEKNISTKNYCLMLATYERRKGHEYLIKAFKEVIKDINDIELRIYGHGQPHEKKYVSNLVKTYKLQDKILLGDFEAKTERLIANAKVLLVPSQAYESFGLTIIEAMSHGIPVITTDVGGMPEVMGDSEAGFICSKDDPLQFANAIKRILNDDILSAKLGDNGRKAFKQRFNAKIMTAEYAKIIKG